VRQPERHAGSDGAGESLVSRRVSSPWVDAEAQETALAASVAARHHPGSDIGTNSGRSLPGWPRFRVTRAPHADAAGQESGPGPGRIRRAWPAAPGAPRLFPDGRGYPAAQAVCVRLCRVFPSGHWPYLDPTAPSHRCPRRPASCSRRLYRQVGALTQSALPFRSVRARSRDCWASCCPPRRARAPWVWPSLARVPAPGSGRTRSLGLRAQIVLAAVAGKVNAGIPVPS